MKAISWPGRAGAYRGPVLASLVALLAFASWMALEWSRTERRERRHMKWIAGEIHRVLSTCYFQGGVPAVREFLPRVLSPPSPVAGIRLERGGQVLLGAGWTEDLLPRRFSPGELSTEETLVFWARLGEVRYRGSPEEGQSLQELHPTRRPGERRGGPAPPRPPHPHGGETARLFGELVWGPGGAPTSVGPEEPILVIRMNPRGRPGLLPGPLVDSSLLLLLLVSATSGGIAAWALGIRSRLLSEALERSRGESAHLEEFGLTAAGLAHETKNPLGIILGLAQRISRCPEEAEQVREMAHRIQDAADRATARLEEFLSYARLQAPKQESVSGPALVGQALEALGPEFEDSRVSLRSELEEVSLHCDPAMTLQVLVNLLLNSLHACSPGDQVLVRLQADGSRVARIEVVDSGSGIPEELRSEVWKPYVTGRSEGHGLGLAIVQRIARGHGWQVTLRSAEDSGTTVVLDGIRRGEPDRQAGGARD